MTDTEIAQLTRLPAATSHQGSWFVGPVDAHPYPWPYDHSVDTRHLAVILSDCTGATDPSNHDAALHMVTMEGGVFGAVAESGAVIAATYQAATYQGEER